LPQSFKE